MKVLFSFALLLSLLSGCRTDNNTDEPLSEYVYVPQLVSLPGNGSYVEHLTYHNDKVYFASTNADNIYLYNFMQTDFSGDIYSMNSDGTGLARLENYVPSTVKPEGFDGWLWLFIRGLTVDSEGYLWVVENRSFFRYNFFEDDDPTDYYETHELYQRRKEIDSVTVLRKLDATGKEILSVDLSSYPNMKDELYCVGFVAAGNADAAGDIIYLVNRDRDRLSNATVYAFDSSGALLFSFKLDKDDYSDYRFIKTPDGSAAFPVARMTDPESESGFSGYGLRKIDSTAKKPGELISVPDFEIGWLPPGAGPGHGYAPFGGRPDSGSGHFYSGNGEFDFFLNGSDGVYGWNTGEDTLTPVLNWLESGIVIINEYNLMVELLVTPEEHVVCINENNYRNSRMARELLVLKKTLRSEVADKTVLTLATIGVSESLSYAVMEFNKYNQDYIIEIADYSQYNTDYDGRPALMQLATDINSGNIPDIICANRLPYVDYSNAGLFADLYPFIDADPEYSIDDFVWESFRAYEVDGGLYKIFPSFEISTIFSNLSVIDRETGWNMEEFINTICEFYNPETFQTNFISKLRLLEMELTFNYNNYVDNSGNVSFDSPEFIKILELINRFPKDIDTISVFDTSNQYFVDNTTISRFSDLRHMKANYGTEVVINGWPTDGRNGHLLISGYESLSIADSCEHKDAAWAFVQIYLDENWQLYLYDLNGFSGGFPTNKAAFDRLLSNAVGSVPVITYYNQVPYSKERKVVTQEDVDRIMRLINTAFETSSQGAYLEETLWNIISEEASDYFEGVATAEDTARKIQSRVQIYVSERK